MQVLRVNAGIATAALHDSPAALDPVLRRVAAGAGPIIVMIHGYKYDPNVVARCPHRSLLRARGAWLRGLGFTGTGAPGGLALAFGWSARGALRQVAARASGAGAQLGTVLGTLYRAAPHRPVHIITHSMGAAVAFGALHTAPKASIGRLITLMPAAYRSTAQAALSAPAGRTAEWINVTSAENAVFDTLFARLVPAPEPSDRVIGAYEGLHNAVTLHLDCPQTLAKVQAHGGDIAPRQARICHWSGYTRPGALAFYSRLMRDPQALPLSEMRQFTQHEQPSVPIKSSRLRTRKAPQWVGI